jgi:nucleoside-diphosphate-sugar epimerase
MNLESRRVLVTGAAGVIGRELLKRLDSVKAEVLALDIAPTDRAVFPLRHVQVDLCHDELDIVSRFDPEVVFHLAATFERTEETPEFWDSNFDNNVSASHRLIQTLKCSQSVQVVIFASSYLAYNPALYLNSPVVRKLTESDPSGPRNLVGLAKYFTERELEFLESTTHKFRPISVRIFRVYGCGSRDVISRWIRRALESEPIEVYGRHNRFDYIYADDVAEGLIRLAGSPAANGIVNLGTGNAVCVNDVVKTITKTVKGVRVRDLSPHGPTEGSCADMQRFKKLTTWTPKTSVEDGIRNIIAYETQKHVAESDGPETLASHTK